MSDWIRHHENEDETVVLAYKNPETRESKYLARLDDGSYSLQYWPDLAKKVETVSLLGFRETKEEAAELFAQNLNGYTKEHLYQQLK